MESGLAALATTACAIQGTSRNVFAEVTLDFAARSCLWPPLEYAAIRLRRQAPWVENLFSCCEAAWATQRARRMVRLASLAGARFGALGFR